MAQINLLPWREQERQVKKIYFGILVGIAVGITILLIIITHFYLTNEVSKQMERNSFLQTTITQEQTVLTNLEDQAKRQELVNSQLQFLFNLRKNSYNAARLLDILTQIIPEGISLISLSRENNKIILLGKAQSDFQVTMFMKNILTAQVFKQPALTEISSTKTETGAEEKIFQLQLELQD